MSLTTTGHQIEIQWFFFFSTMSVTHNIMDTYDSTKHIYFFKLFISRNNFICLPRSMACLFLWAICQPHSICDGNNPNKTGPSICYELSFNQCKLYLHSSKRLIYSTISTLCRWNKPYLHIESLYLRQFVLWLSSIAISLAIQLPTKWCYDYFDASFRYSV